MVGRRAVSQELLLLGERIRSQRIKLCLSQESGDQRQYGKPDRGRADVHGHRDFYKTGTGNECRRQ